MGLAGKSSNLFLQGIQNNQSISKQNSFQVREITKTNSLTDKMSSSLFLLRKFKVKSCIYFLASGIIANSFQNINPHNKDQCADKY